MPHANKKMISFFLTTKCNLCVRYCYNANERNLIEEKTLPLEIAYAGINWFFLDKKAAIYVFMDQENRRKNLSK